MQYPIIPHSAFCPVVGYAKVPRNFLVLDDEKSERVLSSGLLPAPVVQAPKVTIEQFADAIEPFDDDLDREIAAKRRVEQAFLRQHLFGNSLTGTCALYGEVFPTDLLVAAHIKRRADSETHERLDVGNIVIAACAFGCDDLYEHGYLTVDEHGRILISPAPIPSTDHLSRRLAELQGRPCAVFTEGSQGYFAWHRTHIFQLVSSVS